MPQSLFGWIKGVFRQEPGENPAQRSAQHLHSDDARLKTLLDALPDAVLRISVKGRCLDLSPGRDHILPETAAAGLELATLLPEVQESLPHICNTAFFTGTPQHFTYSTGPTEKVRHMEGRVSRSGEQELLITIADVTARTVAESRLASSEKMATLGLVSAGIAHEINNPLMVVASTAKRLGELAKDADVSAADAAEISRKIDEMVTRINTIIRSLRQLSRGGSEDPLVPTPVHTIVESALAISRTQLCNLKIDLRVESDAADLIALCRPVEISQVVLNLVANAIDAVRYADKRWIHIDAYRRDCWVDLAVSDSGPGVPKALQAKIMEPFFTTKSTGTGLGLSLSREIALRHKGHLILDPIATHTRFVLSLPAA